MSLCHCLSLSLPLSLSLYFSHVDQPQCGVRVSMSRKQSTLRAPHLLRSAAPRSLPQHFARSRGTAP